MQPRLKPRSPSATRWFEGDGGRQAATLAASQAERRPTGDSGIQYVFDRHPLVAAALLDDMQFRKRPRERAPPLLVSWNRRLVMLHWLDEIFVSCGSGMGKLKLRIPAAKTG